MTERIITFPCQKDVFVYNDKSKYTLDHFVKLFISLV